MKRLRVFFTLLLALAFLPLWRALDFQTIIAPSAFFFSLSILGISFFTLLLAARIHFPKIPKKYLFISWLIFGSLIWLSGSPLSNKSTYHPELRHCSLYTFGGLAYQFRSIIPPGHHDDALLRNQMCWVRKMISRSPQEISDVMELKNYLDLVRKKLLSPEVKYRAVLPLIAILHGKMSTTITGDAFHSVEIGKMFVDSLHFWKTQYTTEISSIDYPWYAWPHSQYIQFEYGLIEKNWEALVDSVQIEFI